MEVDVFRLCWKDSWMSLKPPKYLYLKAKEQEIKIPGFTTIVLAITRKYKPQEHHLGAEWACPAYEWTQCWKQVHEVLLSWRNFLSGVQNDFYGAFVTFLSQADRPCMVQALQAAARPFPKGSVKLVLSTAFR